MTTPRKLLAVMFATLLAASVVCCAGDEEPGDRGNTKVPEAEDVIDEGLMLALQQSKNFHRKAKVYMTDGQLDEAIKAVGQILTVQFPPDSPEGEDVYLDAYALLAKLQILKGDTGAAMKAVDTGIASAKRKSFFLANLHTVKGEVYEAIAAGHDDPKSPEARAAFKSAIESYDTSIQINEELQKALADRLKGKAP
jgi:tetratricopeptide (TPR) repeat protein